MLLSLGHVTVRSADFDRTERFYCDLLGMRIGPRPTIAVPGRWFYIGDLAVLHVLPRTAEATTGAGGSFDHFAIAADNLPAFHRRFESAGQHFESRRLADTDTWQVFLTDPDGVRVELSFQMPPPEALAMRALG